jgi:hypothetical protein
MLVTILLVAALVLFILAGVGVPAGRYNLIGWGLACLTAAQLIGHPGLIH